jgi:hypothetical protein
MHRSRDLVKPIVLVLIEEQYPLLTLKMAEQKVNPVKVVVNSGVAAGCAKKVSGNFSHADAKRAKSGCISVFQLGRSGAQIEREEAFVRRLVSLELLEVLRYGFLGNGIGKKGSRLPVRKGASSLRSSHVH